MTLITGASAGIGAAFARRFAERGHECVLVARREAQLLGLAAEITKAGRKRPHVLALDLTAHDAGARIAKELDARSLEPAIVVNNAGFGLHGEAGRLDRREQLAMVDLNVRLVTDLSLRFVASLRRYGGGVINIASLAAFFPGPGMAVYFASKAYVLTLSEALRRELLPRGVKVTCICPGPVPTEFQARAGLGPGALSPMMTRSADAIAAAGYDAFMRGKGVVVPGFLNKLASVLPRVLPRAFVLAQIARYQAKNAPKPTEIDTPG